MTPAGVRRVPRWPLLIIAAGAFVSIWSGWVGLGKLTGFGPVVLLPGIADEWVINSAITLPLGVEAYAAYAMWVWLSDAPVSERARTFARRSALGALALGAAGQITYHLLTAAGFPKAPWPVTAFVSCLPVVVLGCGAALVHLIHRQEDEQPPAAVAPTQDVAVDEPVDLDEVPDFDDLHDFVPRDWWAPTDSVDEDQVDEPVGDQPPAYRDKSLPTGRRIALATEAAIDAGEKPPGQRRLAELIGESRHFVRDHFERVAKQNGHHPQEQEIPA